MQVFLFNVSEALIDPGTGLQYFYIEADWNSGDSTVCLPDSESGPFVVSILCDFHRMEKFGRVKTFNRHALLT